MPINVLSPTTGRLRFIQYIEKTLLLMSQDISFVLLYAGVKSIYNGYLFFSYHSKDKTFSIVSRRFDWEIEHALCPAYISLTCTTEQLLSALKESKTIFGHTAIMAWIELQKDTTETSNLIEALESCGFSHTTEVKKAVSNCNFKPRKPKQRYNPALDPNQRSIL